MSIIRAKFGRSRFRSVSATSVTSSSSLRSQAFIAGGALVFAVALGVGAWRFVALGTPPAGGAVLPAALVNAALFGAFALHHSVLAREPIKARVARLVSPRLERTTYVWVASLLFIAVCLAWQPIAGLVYDLEPPWAWGIGAIQLTGGVLTLDAARRIDLRVLSGLRMEPPVTEPALGDDRDSPIVAAGGYRVVRHPIYLGWVLLVWATPEMTTGRLVFAAISTAYLVAAVPFEERSLRRRFGAAYTAYTRQVRWRIVPGLF
jgi:methanethiol S-methyltransferase